MLSLIINKLNRIMKTNFKIVWLIALMAGMPLLLSAQEKNHSSVIREGVQEQWKPDVKKLVLWEEHLIPFI